MLVLSLIVAMMAVARLTRLVTTDKIGEPLRRWAINRWGEDSLIAYLAHCPACASVWLAAPTSAAWWLAGTEAAFFIPAALLAMSQAAILFASLDRE